RPRPIRARAAAGRAPGTTRRGAQVARARPRARGRDRRTVLPPPAGLLRRHLRGGSTRDRPRSFEPFLPHWLLPLLQIATPSPPKGPGRQLGHDEHLLRTEEPRQS